MKLNARQKAFCEFYVACGNATEAAKKAGYKENTARIHASKLLTNANIKNYIQELMDKIEEKRMASAEEVIKFLTASMRGEIEEEVIVVEGQGDGVSEARKEKNSYLQKIELKQLSF